MKENKYLSLIKNMGVFAIGILGAKFIQFLLLPFFTNLLTTKEYGVIDLVITFTSLLVPIVTFNLADAVLRFGLSKDVKSKDVLQNALFVLFISTVITIALSPVFNFIPMIGEWKNYVILLIAAQSFRINFSLYVKANEKVIVYSIDSILYAFVVAGCDIIFLAYLKLGVSGYFIAEITGNCVSILFLIIRGKIFSNYNIKRKINVAVLNSMIKYSLPLLLNAISWWVTNFADRMFINLYHTESDVGIYSVASKIPAIVTTGLSVFTQAWIMSSIKEYDTNRDPRFFKNVFTYYNTFLAIAISGVILLVQPFMNIYIGKNFSESWRYVPFLLIGTYFLGISNYYGAIYAAAKENIKEVKTTLICAISNIILNMYLIPKYKIMGAVIATMLAFVINVFVRIHDTKKIINIEANVTLIFVNMTLILIEAISIVQFGNYYVAVIAFTIITLLGSYTVIKDRIGVKG